VLLEGSLRQALSEGVSIDPRLDDVHLVSSDVFHTHLHQALHHLVWIVIILMDLLLDVAPSNVKMD
jgi:hypothetical protein